jgi:hypothetical protein
MTMNTVVTDEQSDFIGDYGPTTSNASQKAQFETLGLQQASQAD